MIITERQINEFIDERYRERGKRYCEDGMIQFSEINAANISAKCVGTHVYLVNLSFKKDQLQGDCDCPAFDKFGPCKHMAALAYATISRQNSNYSSSLECLERITIHQKLVSHLNKFSKTELVDLILKISEQDEELLCMLEDEIAEH